MASPSPRSWPAIASAARAAALRTHEELHPNIYLTIYWRRLLPDVQIITRAVHERNVSTLHRAGAAFVLSYAWMGATAIFNHLERADVLMVAEGLHVCETEVPPALAGKTLAEAAIPRDTGCSVVALGKPGGLQINSPRHRGNARRRTHHPHLHPRSRAALQGALQRTAFARPPGLMKTG